MKTVGVRELQQKIRECVDLAQKERVVVTRHGRPAAVVIGVEGQDWETLALQTDAAFWNMIKRRRKQKTVSSRDLRKRLHGWQNAKGR